MLSVRERRLRGVSLQAPHREIRTGQGRSWKIQERQKEEPRYFPEDVSAVPVKGWWGKRVPHPEGIRYGGDLEIPSRQEPHGVPLVFE